MPQPRKTVEIEYVKRTINACIARSTDIEARKELCVLLGNILWNANAYNGFRYLDGWSGTEDWRHEFY